MFSSRLETWMSNCLALGEILQGRPLLRFKVHFCSNYSLFVVVIFHLDLRKPRDLEKYLFKLSQTDTFNCFGSWCCWGTFQPPSFTFSHVTRSTVMMWLNEAGAYQVSSSPAATSYERRFAQHYIWNICDFNTFTLNDLLSLYSCISVTRTKTHEADAFYSFYTSAFSDLVFDRAS